MQYWKTHKHNYMCKHCKYIVDKIYVDIYGKRTVSGVVAKCPNCGISSVAYVTDAEFRRM